jgi:RsiW-degrading membrane proteinase PrsW (M82 family)
MSLSNRAETVRDIAKNMDWMFVLMLGVLAVRGYLVWYAITGLTKKFDNETIELFVILLIVTGDWSSTKKKS